MLRKPILLLVLVLSLDQCLKIWIKTNMMLGQEHHIFDWFIIHFTENKGMAFGMEFGGEIGKYFLSIFRMVAIGFIAVYLKKLAAQNVNKGILYSIVFQGGYAGLLQGKVVDMFYFPLINSHFPDWVPLIGGNHFIFFRPVFNIADASISVGVINILLFHRSFFK